MAEAKVDQFIAENPVMVFSKSYCPFCKKVKKLLDDAGVSYKAIELDNMDDGDAIQSAVASKVGARTVPRVFIAGEHIGGCDDTEAAKASGALKSKLVAAGIAFSSL